MIEKTPLLEFAEGKRCRRSMENESGCA